MKKNTAILTAICLISIGAAIANPHSIMQLPWDTSLSFKKNITPYLVIAVISFACYASIGTIYTSLGIQDTKKHKNKVIGNIINIEYSSIRINNSPRFKITTEYLGITKSFDALDETVQFHLKIGDDAIIYHEENNPHNSHLNLEETIQRKGLSDAKKVEANAKFKLIEINQVNDTSEYEIIGNILNDNKENTKASFKQKITDDNLKNFVPGMIIPCRVEGTGRELTISMIVS